MILMGYERGDLAAIQPFLSEDIYESFVDGVSAREDQGLTIEAEFVGVRELTLTDAKIDPDTKMGEVTIRFVGELTSVCKGQRRRHHRRQPDQGETTKRHLDLFACDGR